MTPPDDKPEPPARSAGTGTDIARPLDPDYEAILAAVSETARGRWFLNEYARRNRTADTKTLLGALNRLQSSLDRLPAPAAAQPASLVDNLKARVTGLADVISQTRVEIVAVPRYGEDGAVRRNATDVDLDMESDAGKTAFRQVHEAADRIQEIVWNLREKNVSAELCDVLDRSAADIQAACRNGTATLKGMDAMGRGLRQLEQRIAEFSESLDTVPVAEPERITSRDIFADDPAAGRFIEDMDDIDDVEAEAAAEPEGAAAPSEARADNARQMDDDVEFVDDDGISGFRPDEHVRPIGTDRDTAFIDVPETHAPGPQADPSASEPVDAESIEPTGTVTRLQGAERPDDTGRDAPPADLTGLTFDQKMILFS